MVCSAVILALDEVTEQISSRNEDPITTNSIDVVNEFILTRYNPSRMTDLSLFSVLKTP